MTTTTPLESLDAAYIAIAGTINNRDPRALDQIAAEVADWSLSDETRRAFDGMVQAASAVLWEMNELTPKG